MRLFSTAFAAVVLAKAAMAAGPLEFGMNELKTALAEREVIFKTDRLFKQAFQVDVSLDRPETFSIEPNRLNGAHISGGDLRGLMYGLLTAAEQLRLTGKLEKINAAPSVRAREVRVELTPALEAAPEGFWNNYFQMLARHRFNAVHVVFPVLNQTLIQTLAKAASDYALDFVIEFTSSVAVQDLKQLIATTPNLRVIAAKPQNLAGISEAISSAGRLIKMEWDGDASLIPAGIPLSRAPSSWPPSFEITPPPGYPLEHETWFALWGRGAFDAKIPPIGITSTELAAAKNVTLWLSTLDEAKRGGSVYIASPTEIRPQEIGAKFTAAQIAFHLTQAAARLNADSNHGLALLKETAQKAAETLPKTPRLSPPTDWVHVPTAGALTGKPLALALKIGNPQTLACVRLHYRIAELAQNWKSIELAAAPELAFEIPAEELSPNRDLEYFFEVVAKDGGGWFVPDPLVATPHWTVQLTGPRTGNN